MRQGQLCRIQAHSSQDPLSLLSGGGGWFIKLGGRDGKTKYHLVDNERTLELSIPESMVDTSLCNRVPEKPYYVVFVVPEELQSRMMHVSPDLDKLATSACIEEKIEILSSERNSLLENQRRAERELEACKENIREIEDDLAEFQKIAHMQEPCFVYAYGKHPGNDQEFCWRVPFELCDFVKVGRTISVETKRGADKAVVTRIEKSPYLLCHKCVTSLG